MRVHLINPSHLAFGVGVITPRWLYVLAAATPAEYGDPVITDETLEILEPEIDPARAISSASASTRATPCAATKWDESRASAAPGSSSAASTPRCIPEEPKELGGAHAVVKGDGDVAWGHAVRDCAAGTPQPVYEGGPSRFGFVPARAVGL